MPESHLWLVNHLGSVFTLGTFHRKFRQLQNTWDDGVNVKRLSASHWCAWAIGHDHRVYIYVRATDVPIRVPETTFENQRWSPIHGFSKSSLIKTDRPAWSNEAGTVYRPKESVRLPSAHWEWEGDWLIDDNLRGEVVGIEGWQYAFDFPAVYTPEKHWNSFVRKRKWIRFRRYSSTDLWARISDMEVVERTECFIDISVGSFLMPSQPAGFLSVWAVTNNGHVYVRTDVCHDNPEGSTWQELAIPDHLGIINISVGATNLVWAVTWDGSMVVRSQVTRNNIYGSGWIVVDHPDTSTRFMQVSVGRNAVWAVSRDGKVWFRKGTSGDDMFWNCESAVGTSWVEMVGEMLQVAVSSNDQVFAVDLTGKNIYFRTGVTSADLTGKTWQPVHLQEDLAFLEKEGLLSEGDICYCGDPDVPCDLHAEIRPRLSSTATTASSISTVTNVEESSDGLISPQQLYQQFPDYITESFPFDVASASLWKQSHFISEDSDHESAFQDQPQTMSISNSATDTSLSSYQFHSYAVERNNIVNKEEKQLEKTVNLQQSSSRYQTMTTSQSFVLPQGSSPKEVTFHDLVVMESPNTVKTNHTLTENTQHTASPGDNQSLECVQILSETGTKVPESSHIKDELSANMSHYVEKSRTLTKTSSSESVSSKLFKEVDLATYVVVPAGSKDNEEDSKMKLTSVSHISDIAVNALCFPKSINDSENILAESVDKHDHVPQSNNSLERIQQANESCDGPILLPQKSDSELTTQQLDRKLHTPAITDNICKENNSNASKLLVDVAEGMDNKSLAKQMGELSVEGDHSLLTMSCSFDKAESLPEIISSRTDEKHLPMHKKKSKERRPKVINLSLNDPNDDSILFKTYKTRKKRHGKSVNIVSDKSEKTDTVSVSSDTSHSLTDVTELSVTDESVHVSGEDHQAVAVDFTDGRVGDSYSHGLHHTESSYQSLSTDNSYQPPSFPSLSTLYGEYLTTVGFSTDSAHALLTNLEMVDTHLTPPMNAETRNSVNKLHGASVPARSFDRPSPFVLTSDRGSVKHIAASGTDRSKPVVSANDRISPKPVIAETDRFSPKPAISFNNIDSHGIVKAARVSPKSETVSRVLTYHNDNLRHTSNGFNNQGSNGQGHLQGTNDFTFDVIGHDSAYESPKKHNTNITNSLDATAQINPAISIFSDHKMGNGKIPLKIGDEIVAGEHWTVSLLHADETVKYFPVQENEYNPQHTNLPVDMTVESKDVEEFGCSGAHRLDAIVSDTFSHRKVIGQDEARKESSLESRQLLKIEEFSDKKFPSLDSTSTSDTVFDFVTDLLVSDDESQEKQSESTQSCPQQRESTQSCGQCSLEAGSAEEVTQSQTALESMKFHSQTSIASSKSTGSGMSNMTRDSSEDVETNEKPVPHTAEASPYSTSTASHPRSLPIGRKVMRYVKTPSPCQVLTGDVIPIISLTEAQPRLCWRWLDATSCVIDDPSAVDWLSFVSKESDARRKFVKISKQLREDVLKKLQDRNRREGHRFKDIEQAIQRTTWVKKVNMQMYVYGRKGRWIPCSVELEQGITNLREGSLTVHYQQKRKPKNIQIMLSEMICVKPCSDPDNSCGFVVYTPATNIVHQPLLLKAGSENEAIEWMGCLSLANAAVWGMNCSATPGAIWSCTFSGDVFISPASSVSKSPSELCWGQHGGHMRLVETGPSGVTWALGFDKMPYVYNSGYGGAFNTGMSDMSENTQQIVDHHRVFVYENQKWFPVIGWCCKGVFQHDFHWLTEFGRSVETKEDVKLPSSKCQWISEWTVDFSTPGGVDAHGWQYSSNLYGPFYPRQHLRSSYRRRRWLRHYKITVFGPWQTAGSLGLVDLSIQVDPIASILDPVVLWAVGANGDVLCRYGVTASNPKGQSWIHVATDLDKPFKSISVGGGYRVWGIAGDGSAWFRPGVSPYHHTGSCWLQVVPPPPGTFPLHQVSAGETSVWAVDTGDNLWHRENITPTFPEGTGWELISSQVKRVCVGPRDQVWIITDAYFSKMKHGAGVIYRRVGITSTKPSGTDWEVVIGSGWSHVSVRGFTEVKQDGSLTASEEENS